MDRILCRTFLSKRCDTCRWQDQYFGSHHDTEIFTCGVHWAGLWAAPWTSASSRFDPTTGQRRSQWENGVQKKRRTAGTADIRRAVRQVSNSLAANWSTTCRQLHHTEWRSETQLGRNLSGECIIYWRTFLRFVWRHMSPEIWDNGHSKFSEMAGGHLLDLVQPEVGPFDPPSPKTLPYNQTWSGSDDPLPRFSEMRLRSYIHCSHVLLFATLGT